MRERFHHMIFYRRDADSQFLMNITIAEFFDAVHQKDTPGFARHRLDSLLIEPHEIRSFQTLFLIGGTRRIMFLFEGIHQHIVALPTAGTVDQQILRDAMQKSRGVG